MPVDPLSNLNLGPMDGALGMGVVRTLSIMPYSIASFGSIHLLRDNSRITWWVLLLIVKEREGKGHSRGQKTQKGIT